MPDDGEGNSHLPSSARLPDSPEIRDSLRRYWAKNLVIMSGLLIIWAAAGLGCGIIFADQLNAYKLPGTGYPLGFWFAHQGAIMVFVLIILTYCILMNGLDRKHHEEIIALRDQPGAEQPSRAADAKGGAA